MLGLLSCALKRVIIELCQEKSSNHEKHGWNFYAKVVFLQPLKTYFTLYFIFTVLVVPLFSVTLIEMITFSF